MDICFNIYTGAVDNLVIGTVVEWIYASIYSMGAVDNLVIGTVVEWIYASIYSMGAVDK